MGDGRMWEMGLDVLTAPERFLKSKNKQEVTVILRHGILGQAVYPIWFEDFFLKKSFIFKRYILYIKHQFDEFGDMHTLMKLSPQSS